MRSQKRRLTFHNTFRLGYTDGVVTIGGRAKVSAAREQTEPP
jgi:hypothetical protein